MLSRYQDKKNYFRKELHLRVNELHMKQKSVTKTSHVSSDTFSRGSYLGGHSYLLHLAPRTYDWYGQRIEITMMEKEKSGTSQYSGKKQHFFFIIYTRKNHGKFSIFFAGIWFNFQTNSL